MAKKLTKKQKADIVGKSTELSKAVLLIHACMIDIKAKKFIKYYYTIDKEEYELRFKKINKNDTHTEN